MPRPDHVAEITRQQVDSAMKDASDVGDGPWLIE